MASFDYIGSRKDADDLVAEFGQAVALRRTTKSGTPWEPSESAADYATVAAILDYNVRQVDGVNILRTDRRAIVAAGPLGAVVPTVPDKLVVGGTAIPIVNVKPLNPAGVAVLYECQLRV
jgi:hypothetical protein